MSRRSSSITIRDVARQAGVSVATVSRYINHNAPVSAEAAERLDKVMGELKFVPHAAARHLASRKTRAVGFLTDNIRNDFFVPLLNGIEAVVSQKGYNWFIATYHEFSRETTPPPLGPHNTDGLLIFTDGLNDEDLAELSARGFPMVLVHRTPPSSLSIPSVTVENVEVTRRIIEHLIQDHNRRRILFFRGPINQQDSNLREKAYRRALEANGIPYDEKLTLNGEFNRDVAYQVMNEYLTGKEALEFDAVFCGNDEGAMGVLRALHQHNIQVPEDVSVVGFDDLGFARFLDPPLTTVHAPTETVGRIAAERLFNLLENQPADGVLVLPTEIVYRRSCGCPFEPNGL